MEKNGTWKNGPTAPLSFQQRWGTSQSFFYLVRHGQANACLKKQNQKSFSVKTCETDAGCCSTNGDGLTLRGQEEAKNAAFLLLSFPAFAGISDTSAETTKFALSKAFDSTSDPTPDFNYEPFLSENVHFFSHQCPSSVLRVVTSPLKPSVETTAIIAEHIRKIQVQPKKKTIHSN
jgi:broad specificity phosphatase PhoE